MISVEPRIVELSSGGHSGTLELTLLGNRTLCEQVRTVRTADCDCYLYSTHSTLTFCHRSRRPQAELPPQKGNLDFRGASVVSRAKLLYAPHRWDPSPQGEAPDSASATFISSIVHQFAARYSAAFPPRCPSLSLKRAANTWT